MRTKTLYLCAFALLLITAQADATPPTIQLTGTIRDFSMQHPDFEHFTGSVPTLGIVAGTLDANKKPIYVPGNTVTSGQANFDQWFRNVAGVNQWDDITITLTNDGAGVYDYTNDEFFPIDNQLGGNEGYPHNYAFTVEFHTVFTYKPGQVFSFSGDDDIWIFVNNKLELDLGGPHPKASGSINLDGLGLADGNDYTLDIFYAERHTSESHFRIQTSLQLKPAPPICPHLPEQQAVFQWYNCKLPDYFYTADPAGEIAQANGWDYEKIAFYTLIYPGANTKSIYRLWNGSNHFYTTSASEKATAQAGGYTDEGVLGYCYTSQEAGTVPLKRYKTGSNGSHFYARDNAAAPAGYNYELTMCYIY